MGVRLVSGTCMYPISGIFISALFENFDPEVDKCVSGSGFSQFGVSRSSRLRFPVFPCPGHRGGADSKVGDMDSRSVAS